MGVGAGVAGLSVAVSRFRQAGPGHVDEGLVVRLSTAGVQPPGCSLRLGGALRCCIQEAGCWELRVQSSAGAVLRGGWCVE
jgi:hypothetical protein